MEVIKELDNNTNKEEPYISGVVKKKEEPVDTGELDLSVSQLEGVGAVTQKKLETFGITNLIDICVRGAREVSEITSVAKPTCDSWVFKAQKLLEDHDMIRKSDMGVMDLMDYHEQLPTVKTGCTEVDDLMGGGVRPEATYEIYGEFGAGKTQFCNTLTCNAISKGDNVIWIDCEDTFKPKRIVEIPVSYTHLRAHET